MKKILLSFVAFLLMAFAVFAGNGVVSWTGADDWTSTSQKDTLTLVQEPYTIVLTKSGGQTDPLIAKANDARVYAK